MKKYILIVLTIGLVIGMVSFSSAQDKVTIDLYGVQWLQGHLEEMPKIIEKFNETHPNIKINYIQGQWAALRTMIATGTPAKNLPDVINVNTSTAMEFGRRGSFADLTEFVLRDNIEEKMVPFAIDAGRDFWGEHIWFLGDEFEVNALMFYNAGLLKDAGIEAPEKNETWSYQQGREAMKKVADPARDLWGILQNVTVNVNEWFIPAVWCWGSDFFVEEDGKWKVNMDQAAVDVLQYYYDLVVEDKTLSPETAGISIEGMSTRFVDEKILFASYGPYFYNMIERAAGEDLDWGVMQPWKEKETVTQIENTGYAIAANSEHKEEAWEVVKFLLFDESKKIYNKKELMFPASKEFFEDPMFRSEDDMMYVQWLATQNGRLQINHPIIEALHKDVMIPYVGMMFEGLVTPQEVADAIEKEGNYLIEQMEGN